MLSKQGAARGIVTLNKECQARNVEQKTSNNNY
jgi:hypothetical protein